MSERDTSRFGPVAKAEQEMYDYLEQQHFAHRANTADILQVMGAGEWVKPYVRDSAVEYRQKLANQGKEERMRSFRDYRQNYFQPVKRGLEPYSASYETVSSLSMHWYGVTHNLLLTMSRMARQFEDEEMVPYPVWHSQVVSPRITEWVDNSQERTYLWKLTQSESLYKYKLQWGSYAHSVGAYVLEEAIFNQMYHLDNEDIGNVIETVQKDSLLRCAAYTEKNGAENLSAEKLAEQAFAYTPELLIDATYELNRLASGSDGTA